MSSNLKTKKICMLAMSTYPNDPRIRREAEALRDEGIKVDIICMYKENQSKIEDLGGITAYRIFKYSRQEKIIKYIVQSILFMVIAFFKLQVLSIKHKYQVIQAHNLPDYLIFIGIIQKLFGTKLIIDIHDPSVELFEEKWHGKEKKVLLKILKLLEMFSLKVSDHIITVTETCKKNLVKRSNPEKKITLVLNTADENIFKFNEKRDFKIINKGAKLLYHGTIANRFGIHNAIKAIKLVQKDIPGTVLDIYGSYENLYRRELDDLIQELDVGNLVNLNGIIRLDNIPDLIKMHDIGIVPHLDTKFNNLGLPTKAFEYVFCGIPVISTKFDELSDILDNTCITYVNSGTAEGFAAAIKKLCLDPVLRKSQTELAYKKVQKISGKVMKDRYVELIKNLSF